MGEPVVGNSVDSATTVTPTPAMSDALRRLHDMWYQRRMMFAAENAALAPESRNVVFVGDSITQAFKLDHYFPGLGALNRGISADGITPSPGMPRDSGLINRMQESFHQTHPRLFVVLIGTNHMPHESEDINMLLSVYRQMRGSVLYHNPDAQWVVVTIPPAGAKRADRALFNERARRYNAGLREYAAASGLPLIDLEALLKDESGELADVYTGDGIHLTDAAYEIWAAEVRKLPALRQQAE